VVYAYNPCYLGGSDQEDFCLKSALANSLQDLISKITRTKWTGDVAQVVVCLLCNCEVLSSNPSLTKKKKSHQTNRQQEHHQQH
jgi:hypothetical protein